MASFIAGRKHIAKQLRPASSHARRIETAERVNAGFPGLSRVNAGFPASDGKRSPYPGPVPDSAEWMTGENARAGDAARTAAPSARSSYNTVQAGVQLRFQ